MATQLTADDARQSLASHVASKGAEIHQKYGPVIGWEELEKILQDKQCTRYPCRVVFGTGSLEAGEFAFPQPVGAAPEEGFIIYVHPLFAGRLNEVPLLVLYQLVLVNYGDFASPDDAEAFGSAALGMTRAEYYEALCTMADEVTAPVSESSCQGTGCCG